MFGGLGELFLLGEALGEDGVLAGVERELRAAAPRSAQAAAARSVEESALDALVPLCLGRTLRTHPPSSVVILRSLHTIVFTEQQDIFI